jgi:hypothetical protein
MRGVSGHWSLPLQRACSPVRTIVRSTDVASIKLTAAALCIGLAEAEFIVAMELGEIDGDVVIVDEDGNEIRKPPSEID